MEIIGDRAVTNPFLLLLLVYSYHTYTCAQSVIEKIFAIDPPTEYGIFIGGKLQRGNGNCCVLVVMVVQSWIAAIFGLTRRNMFYPLTEKDI